MLYTSQAPILDLTGEHIRTKEDIEAAFHALNLCSQEEEEQKSDGRKERRASQSKSLSDSDSSNNNKTNPKLKTPVEERQYNTIPGLAIATHIALSYSRAQANPTVERGPPCQKSSAEKTKAQASGTPHTDK